VISLFGFPENAATSGMSILDIEDGVLLRLFDREVEVNVQVGVGASHEEEETGCVFPNPVKQVVKGYDFACPFAQPDGFASLDQSDELVNHDFQPIFIFPLNPQSLQSGVHPRNMPVMVSAPNINDESVTTLVLVDVIGDV
jgi:hypothetical protein